MTRPTPQEVESLIARLDTIPLQRVSIVMGNWVNQACLILRALSAAPAVAPPREPVDRFRHVKSGRVYILHGPALLESNRQSMTVYESEHDGVVWVRSTDEFFDGRFVAVPACIKAADRIESLSLELDTQRDITDAQAERVQQLEAQANNAIMDASIAAERVKALERDAARYRWLRANRGGDRGKVSPWAMVFDDDLERFIDAALAAQGGLGE